MEGPIVRLSPFRRVHYKVIMEKKLLTLDAKMLGALSTRPGGMTGVSKFAKIRTAVKIGAQFKGITLKDTLRNRTEALLIREAQQSDKLLFAHRRQLARENTCQYLAALIKDDRMLQKWSDARSERHRWVEAAIGLQAAWAARGRSGHEFQTIKERVRGAAQRSARMRIRLELCEICILRAEVHRIASEFFGLVAPSLAKKVQKLRKRLTAVANSAGRGSHKQMMEAIIKRLEPEVLKYEKELDQLEKLMIELDVSSKAEQKELKRAPHRCAVHMQLTRAAQRHRGSQPHTCTPTQNVLLQPSLGSRCARPEAALHTPC
jgi:hypothetical protein